MYEQKKEKSNNPVRNFAHSIEIIFENLQATTPLDHYSIYKGQKGYI